MGDNLFLGGIHGVKIQSSKSNDPILVLRVLFVCAKNQWRSPTAAFVYKNDSRLEVRSAGLSKQSPSSISRKLLEWADIVMVMEKAHSQRIRNVFQKQLGLPEIVSLEIPDDYPFMDPELIDLLKASVEAELTNR